MTWIDYTILIAAALGGGVLATLWKSYRKDWIGLLLSFAGAFILGLIATHLLPGIFAGDDGIRAGLFLLGGFILQLLLSQISQGVEHAHFHKEHAMGHRFYPIFIGLLIHSLIEGLPLEGYPELDMHQGHQHSHQLNHLMIGIALHKLPSAYVLALLMRVNNFSALRFWTFMLVFALASPLGAFMGGFVVADLQVLKYLMAFVVGSLLHIATTILFESDHSGHHHISWRKIIAMFLGIGVALLSLA
jgi:zinc transporter ZupT